MPKYYKLDVMSTKNRNKMNINLDKLTYSVVVCAY